MSKHLNEKQIRGLQKLGDVLLPGHEDLPPFSQTGCERDADRILDYMGEQDLNDLKMLLGLMAVLPRFLVAGFVALVELLAGIPGPAGSLMRFVRLGVRGLIMTLYYSNPRVHALIGYQVGVYTADFQDPYAPNARESGGPRTQGPDNGKSSSTRQASEANPRLGL